MLTVKPANNHPWRKFGEAQKLKAARVVAKRLNKRKWYRHDHNIPEAIPLTVTLPTVRGEDGKILPYSPLTHKI